MIYRLRDRAPLVRADHFFWPPRVNFKPRTISMRFWFLLGVFPWLIFLSGCERAKTEFDREVDRLCAIDGGLRVYEVVDLSPGHFQSDGSLDSSFVRKLGRDDDFPYRTRLQLNVIDEKNQIPLLRTKLTLSRSSLTVLRTKDQKVLAERVIYSRGGGEFYGPWEDGSYSCAQDAPDPVTATFKVGGF